MGNDVTVTLAGFMGTTPKLFTSPTGNDFTSFRIASTTRYLDRSRGEWVDGRTIWFTVKAWRAMAQNVAASLRKGDAVVVTGRLAVDEWTSPEGPRTNLVIEASALGPDLTRGRAQFTNTVVRPAQPDGAQDAPASGSLGAVPGSGTSGSGEPTGSLRPGPGDGSMWDLGGVGDDPFPEDDDAEHGLVDDVAAPSGAGDVGGSSDDGADLTDGVDADNPADTSTGRLLATR
ncbi:single-stranded DNA-binding protein [Oerskovia jenensis]|uniref:Single-stranded DNA-binding protein n=1 Tax=Oerskovia jenensis TaxID=162169 RepID=A0ABS2LC97_9CELL|nr:single-stranded DNA-binding protein [Oerskovia jenensis]MBM7477932.1 single-strand DNA-binding protein [Oerskovia jenensis]